MDVVEKVLSLVKRYRVLKEEVEKLRKENEELKKCLIEVESIVNEALGGESDEGR